MKKMSLLEIVLAAICTVAIIALTIVGSSLIRTTEDLKLANENLEITKSSLVAANGEIFRYQIAACSAYWIIDTGCNPQGENAHLVMACGSLDEREDAIKVGILGRDTIIKSLENYWKREMN